MNLVTDRFHCWVCGFAGRNLLPLLEASSEERKEYLGEIDARRGRTVETPEKKYDRPSLPVEFRSLSRPSRSPYCRQAMEYLSSRGVSSDDILRYKLGYCEDGEYKGRIIIPSFDAEGELNFFVGRAIQKGTVSYKHGNFCKDIIFNDLLVDWSAPVIVAEGPFDAIRAGSNSIPLQGTILREGSKLFSKIVLSAVDTYFAMDTDAFDKQLEIIHSMVSYGVRTHYVSLGGKKDVGEMTAAEFKSAFDRAVTVEDEIDVLELRAKSLGNEVRS